MKHVEMDEAWQQTLEIITFFLKIMGHGGAMAPPHSGKDNLDAKVDIDVKVTVKRDT